MGVERTCAPAASSPESRAARIASAHRASVRWSPMDAGGGDVAPFAESRSAIVDDSTDVGPGQMTRGAFMAELRSSLTAICNRELAAVGRTADGCPYLQRWLDYYKKIGRASCR